MATSGNNDDISHMCANLTLADVDDDDVTSMQIPNITVGETDEDPAFYVVGRLATDKLIKFAFFQDTMATVWRPALGFTMKQLQSRRYLIRFYHETDVNRILNDGPWTFEQCLLIMHRLQPGEDPESVPLDQADFWVQIHTLPPGLRSASVVSAIGSFLGTLVQTDDRNFEGSMRTYYRVRVGIDVMKPLRKQMKLKKDNGEWAYVDFRYERLPTFCFLCGIIGHGDKFCPKLVQGVDLSVDKPFGAWLRAGSRKATPTAGQRWIAPEYNAERKNWRAPVMDSYEAKKESESNERCSMKFLWTVLPQLLMDQMSLLLSPKESVLMRAVMAQETPWQQWNVT